jgi:hypothetical protein
MTQPQQVSAYPTTPSGHPPTCRCHGTGFTAVRYSTGWPGVVGVGAMPCQARVAAGHPATCQCAGTGRWLTTRQGRGGTIAMYGPCPAGVAA